MASMRNTDAIPVSVILTGQKEIDRTRKKGGGGKVSYCLVNINI